MQNNSDSLQAVVQNVMPNYDHGDIMDLSDDKSDGVVIKNLKVFIQMILTGNNQCPCVKVMPPKIWIVESSWIVSAK